MTDRTSILRVLGERKLLMAKRYRETGKQLPTPNPIPASENMSVVAIDERDYNFRKTFCRFYDNCLDYAVCCSISPPSGEKWQNWTCRFCKVEDPKDPADIQAENSAILELLIALEKDDKKLEDIEKWQKSLFQQQK